MWSRRSFPLMLLLFGCTSCFAQETVTLPAKGDTCNVIHVNCGAGQQPSNEQKGTRNPGAPGKMGPVGPMGSKGMKGAVGPTGIKGERGRDANAEEIKNEVLGMITGVTSCMELSKKYGVDESGHYLMRVNGTETTVYRHCHFHHYEGIYTCHTLRQSRGIVESGHYILGPRDNPYEVRCVFAQTTAITEVWHDSMSEVQIAEKCETVGCYSRIPRYEIDQESIVRIIDNSARCRQFIKLRCAGVLLLRGENGWWVSRGGEKMQYWGGTTTNGHCGCGTAGSCIDTNYKCNCDNNNANILTQDEGFLQDKTKLPVQEMRFGDMGDSNEFAWHELGALQCHV